MKKLALVSTIALGLLATSSTAQAKGKRLSPEMRACMKEKGCYKTNRACHKATKGMKRGARKAAKKECRTQFRACKKTCRK